MKEPKLRFKADGGIPFPDWEEKKIGELGAFIKGAPLSKADISDCGTPFILYGELYTTYNEVAYDIQRKTQSTVDEKYYSHVGDVVIPTSGETAEEISTATCVMAQNVILAGDLNIYRSDIVDGRIMSYILNHQAKWKIAKLAQGKSVVHIQAAQLSGVAVKYPPSTVEQQKIASLFTELDTLIQSAEKELEGYMELKQGMLQKMFPKNGEKVPKIRFPEFTGDWEQRKLGEIAKTTIGEFVIKSKQDDSYPYPVFNGGSSNTGYYNEFNNEGNKILVSARGANAGFVNIIKTRYWAGNSCYSIDLLDKNIFDTDFIFQEMKRNQARFTDNQQVANIPAVSKSDVEKFIVDVPSYSEQIKISTYFKNLDNLITLQQKELDGYKELKKGLLQQMFC